MQLQLIRNATMRLTYAGRVLLTDPFFSPRHAIRPRANAAATARVESLFIEIPVIIVRCV